MWIWEHPAGVNTFQYCCWASYSLPRPMLESRVAVSESSSDLLPEWVLLGPRRGTCLARGAGPLPRE